MTVPTRLPLNSTAVISYEPMFTSFATVSEVIASTVPALISAVSATKLSIFAVPSICKSFHWSALEPKSQVSSASGNKLELTLPMDALSTNPRSIFAVPSK